MVRSAQINLFPSPNGLVITRVETRGIAAGSHCQRACFKGTKKPIGGIAHRDRHPVSRPPCVVAAREASCSPRGVKNFCEVFSLFSKIVRKPLIWNRPGSAADFISNALRWIFYEPFTISSPIRDTGRAVLRVMAHWYPHKSRAYSSLNVARIVRILAATCPT